MKPFPAFYRPKKNHRSCYVVTDYRANYPANYPALKIWLRTWKESVGDTITEIIVPAHHVVLAKPLPKLTDREQTILDHIRNFGVTDDTVTRLTAAGVYGLSRYHLRIMANRFREEGRLT